MIGFETLWNRLLLDHGTLPTLYTIQSDFHDLLLSVKHSPPHTSSFHSKLFLSSLLSDETFHAPLSKVLANIWLNSHGFTAPLPIKLLDYLTAVRDFQLECYFVTELRSLPDVLYSEVVKRIVEVAVTNTSLLEMFPCVVHVDILKCKIGISSCEMMVKSLEHVTQHIHLLTDRSVNKLIQQVFNISFLVCYKGTGTIIKRTSGPCEVVDEMMFSTTETSSTFDQIPASDSVLAELHAQTKSSCCHFESLTNISSHFQQLDPAYEAAKMFLDSLTVHANCYNKPNKLINMYSLGKYLLSDQLARALYTPDHIGYIRELLGSVPHQYLNTLTSTPIYKTLNFDPETATWSELVTQVRNGLSKSAASFEAMMKTCTLDQDKIDDCISLVDVLRPSQLALLFSRIFATSTCYIPVQHKITVIEKLMITFQGSSSKNLSSFCKSLYNEHGFSFSELEQLSIETKTDLLGDYSNVTRTINQLGSKGTGKWKDKLYHSLLINFILLPDQLLNTVVSQATRNKALTVSVSIFLKDFLPFTLNPLSCASEVVFSSLKAEFIMLKSIKEVRQFDMFIDTLKPILSHQTILKLILLPYTKCSDQSNHFTTLTLLQLYLQREPFYNFSLFYELVRIWASPGLDNSCLELLDDGDILDHLTDQIKQYSKEAYLMVKMVTQGWGWKAGLRFASVMDQPKIKLPKMVGDIDLSDHVTMDCLSFLEGDFRDDKGEKSTSVAQCLLQLAKYSQTLPKFQLLDLCKVTLAENIFTEFNRLPLRSLREWQNVRNFLEECFTKEMIDISSLIIDNKSTSELTESFNTVFTIFNQAGIDSQVYLSNDLLSFTTMSAVSGNHTVLRWFGKLLANSGYRTTVQDEVQVAPSTRGFVLVCVLLKLLPSTSLETLLLSLASNVDITLEDVAKILRIIPESLQSTLSQTISSEKDGDLSKE